MGFGASGSGFQDFGIQVLGFRVSGFRVQGFGVHLAPVEGNDDGIRVEGSGFRAQGSV